MFIYLHFLETNLKIQMLRIAFLFFGLNLSAIHFCMAQEARAMAGKKFTHADTLRGSVNPERAWWDVVHYSIHVTPDYDKKFIYGVNEIRLALLQAGQTMQIDMQEPMKIVPSTGGQGPEICPEGMLFMPVFLGCCLWVLWKRSQ